MIKNEDLNNLNIFSLRELARETGVSSPTSKLKSQLIQEIIEIREGKRDRHVAKTKQGRPPKSSKYEYAKLFSHNTANSSVILRQDRPSYEWTESSILSGFVEVFSNGDAHMVVEGYMNSVYPLEATLTKKYSLKTGDKIVAEIENLDNCTIVKDIYNINGDPITEVTSNRTNYYDLLHEPCERVINVKGFGLDILCGDNVYFYGASNVDNSKMIISILNSMSDVKKVYINLSLTEKSRAMVSTVKGAEMFVANVMDSFDTSKRVVMLAIEYAKRMFEHGENVIIAIDDVLSVSAIEDGELDITKELLSLSKCTQNNGSISIMAIMSKQDKLSWAEKLADKKYVINASEIVEMR